MNYTGIDYHKRYSVACTLDARAKGAPAEGGSNGLSCQLKLRVFEQVV